MIVFIKWWTGERKRTNHSDEDSLVENNDICISEYSMLTV